MKLLVVFLFFIAGVANAGPGERPSKEERRDERRKARIERRLAKGTHPWDKRSVDQKKRDRKALMVLVLSASVLMQVVIPSD